MSIIDIKKLNKLKPQKGRLLIAEPLMLDGNFKRSVVLICEHNEEGTFGFVLNRYLDVDLNDLVESDFPSYDGRLSLGGPVEQNRLMYLHTLGEYISNSHKIVDGLYMGGDLDDLKSQLIAGRANEENVRFFVGYSGWDGTQLDAEMQVNSWIVGEGSLIDPLDANADNLWELTLKKMGRNFEFLTSFPEDPSLN